MPPATQFTPEQAAAIIREATELALAKKSHAGHLDYQDVLSMARELGVDDASVERAIALRREKEAEEARKNVQRETRRAKVQRELAKLSRHAGSYVSILALLTVIDALTGRPWWVQWVAMGWGIGLAAHAWGALSRGLRESLFR